jgi:hypothetical protein
MTKLAPIDNILFWIFLVIAVLGLAWSAFAFSRAFRLASPRDDPDGIRMFFWACGGLAGLVFAGMSIAYILFPLILHYFL